MGILLRFLQLHFGVWSLGFHVTFLLFLDDFRHIVHATVADLTVLWSKICEVYGFLENDLSLIEGVSLQNLLKLIC